MGKALRAIVMAFGSNLIFIIILMLINPILGILWILWLVGLSVFTIKKK